MLHYQNPFSLRVKTESRECRLWSSGGRNTDFFQRWRPCIAKGIHQWWRAVQQQWKHRSVTNIVFLLKQKQYHTKHYEGKVNFAPNETRTAWKHDAAQLCPCVQDRISLAREENEYKRLLSFSLWSQFNVWVGRIIIVYMVPRKTQLMASINNRKSMFLNAISPSLGSYLRTHHSKP